MLIELSHNIFWQITIARQMHEVYPVLKISNKLDWELIVDIIQHINDIVFDSLNQIPINQFIYWDAVYLGERFVRLNIAKLVVYELS